MFQYDSGFSTLVRRVFGCLLLGVLWLVCCLPVVTVGTASCGLYYAVQKHIIREEGELFGCYWHAFKENFRPATLTWLVFLAVGAFLGWDLWYFWQLLLAGSQEGVLGAFILILLILLTLAVMYVFPYLTRFDDGPKQAIKNSFYLMLRHPLVNVKIFVIYLIWVLSLLVRPVYVLALPGFCCWLLALSMEKVFKPYLPEEEMEAEEKG